METKRPFAKVAARASAGFASGAALLFLAPYLGRLVPAALPDTYRTALHTLSALGVCACLLASVALGVIALVGLRKHGRNDILVPACLGLALSVLMSWPILRGVSAGIAAQARETQPSHPTLTNLMK